MGIEIEVSADKVFTDSVLIKATFRNTGPETYTGAGTWTGYLWFQLYVECFNGPMLLVADKKVDIFAPGDVITLIGSVPRTCEYPFGNGFSVWPEVYPIIIDKHFWLKVTWPETPPPPPPVPPPTVTVDKVEFVDVDRRPVYSIDMSRTVYLQSWMDFFRLNVYYTASGNWGGKARISVNDQVVNTVDVAGEGGSGMVSIIGTAIYNGTIGDFIEKYAKDNKIVICVDIVDVYAR